MFDFLFSGWFWGFVLIMVATGSLIKSVFKLKFSLFFLFIVIVLIFIVINFLKSEYEYNVTYLASKEIIKVTDISQLNGYNCAFCKTTFDLTLLDISTGNRDLIEIKNLMGNIKILINKTNKIKVQSKTFFGSTKTPDDTKTILGNNTYITSRYTKSAKHATISVETIFGSTIVFEK